MVFEGINYFNVGWRAENGSIALRQLKEGETKKVYLSQALEIVKSLEEIYIKNKIITIFSDPNAEVYNEILYGDLNQLASNPNRNKILENRGKIIIEVRSTLEKAVEGKEVLDEEVERGIKFFEDIGEKCILGCCPPEYLPVC